MVFAILPLLLKGASFIGLGGVGRRGWGALGIVGALVALFFVWQGVGGWWDTKKLERVNTRLVTQVEKLEHKTVRLEADRDKALRANALWAENAAEWDAQEQQLRDDATAQRARGEQKIAELAQAKDALNDTHFRNLMRLRGVLDNVLEDNRCGEQPIPADVLVWLRESANSYRTSIGQKPTGDPIRIRPDGTN